MKTYRVVFFALLSVGLLTGVSAAENPPVKPAPVVTAFEIQQAGYIEKALERESGLEGKVIVTPQAGIVLIQISRSLPIAKKEEFKAGMRALKADMEKDLQRKVDTLRFVFLNGEFEL